MLGGGRGARLRMAIDRPSRLSLAPVIVVLVLLPAQDRAAQPTGIRPASISGVYKVKATSALADGAALASENILEIVPTGLTAVYFRVHLDNEVGVCGLSGIAHAYGSEFVYREHSDRPGYGATDCVLRISKSGSSVQLSDGDDSCKNYCGARESLADVAFPNARRRPIRYLPRLQRSLQFRAAVAEDKLVGDGTYLRIR